MATQSLLYSSVTAFTLTTSGVITNYAAREGTIVSNSTNLYVDMVLSGKVTVGASAATGNYYILASQSDGTNISYPATGSDAAITIPPIGMAALESLQYGQQVPGTALIFLLKVATAGLAATTAVPFTNVYVAQAFGGNIPIGGWAPVMVNAHGQSTDATGSHFVFNYTGLKYTIA